MYVLKIELERMRKGIRKFEIETFIWQEKVHHMLQTYILLVYRISRKFDMELNLMVDDFWRDRQILIRHFFIDYPSPILTALRPAHDPDVNSI